MNKIPLSYQDTGLYSKIFLDYVNGHPDLENFYGYKHRIQNYKQLAQEYSYDNSIREDLVKVLHGQYADCEIIEYPKATVDLLANQKTFTVTTGHQLNIFTGPLFFIYKIVSTINLCRKLKEEYPDYSFVPVYWMASEDHDADEIDHVHIFNKKLQWEHGQSGAVGHFDTSGIDRLIENFNGIPDVFKNIYKPGRNLSQATRILVNELFKDHGLIILDADDGTLKGHFVDAMKQELEAFKSFEAVSESNSRLEEKGYSIQVNPREINLFYLEGNSRNRIIREGGQYKSLNTDKQINIEELSSHPERFSPNVITRPLYQQAILPNLAYVGGPGEIAYWLQLKEAFETYKITFPILVPRNAALYVDDKSAQKMINMGFEVKDLFDTTESLKSRYLDTLDHPDIEKESRDIFEVYEVISQKLVEADKSFSGFVEKEKALLSKQLERISGKLVKATKQKHDTELSQLEKLKEKFFPQGIPQERVWNILNIMSNKEDYIDQLLSVFDPFSQEYYLLTE